MLTATTRAERIVLQIGDLKVKRSELRDQLYAICGAQAQADRENALAALERQLTRLHVELAGLED